MNKHTPGKWIVGKRYGENDDNLPITDENGNFIALADCADKVNYAGRSINDAHLIAAAPDLYEALRLIVAGYDHDRTVLQRDIMTAKAALAKVGKASSQTTDRRGMMFLWNATTGRLKSYEPNNTGKTGG